MRIFNNITKKYKNVLRGAKWAVTLGAKWAVTLGAKWADALDIRRLVRLWCCICRLNNDDRHSFKIFNFVDLNV